MLLLLVADSISEQRNLTVKIYDIDAHDDFFEAYIGALKEAYVDHAAENEELAEAIERIFSSSVKMHR